MKKVLIFSGTTEGRQLSEQLAAAGFVCTVCVATAYGELVMQPQPGLHIHQGRMTEHEMRQLMEQEQFEAVVDATHPYAEIVSKTIKKSMEGLDLPYYRLNRNKAGVAYAKEVTEALQEKNHYQSFRDAKSCAQFLNETTGNILLTTGSKELEIFATEIKDKSRLFVRVLPGMESLTLCNQIGIYGKQIIAMQGPFLSQMNEAMIQQFHIRILVTKESGANGGFEEKLRSVLHTGITAAVIHPPTQEEGMTTKEVLQALGAKQPLTVSLVGIGVGNQKLLTTEAREAIASAQLLFGASRLLDTVTEFQIPSKSCYLAKDILPILREEKELHHVAILFSGDTGFYSGAQKLLLALKEEEKESGRTFQLRVLPGISSVVYFAARLGISWQDAVLLSMHGKSAPVIETVRESQKTFLILSGAKDVQWLGETFAKPEWKDIRLTLGFQLSYPEEQIFTATPKECMEQTKEGLYIAWIENPAPMQKVITPGMKDTDFLRSSVPMTKEEVREVSISKLQLTKDAILYDIGSGTGSISIEAARLSSKLKVFAIEQNKDAVALLLENQKKFGLSNICALHAKAPEGFESLPTPTHAFIGGSSGNLREILMALRNKNPKLLVVINAITLETVAEISAILEEFQITDEEIVQVQVSRAKKAGRYHLMQAENPVYVIRFHF